MAVTREGPAPAARPRPAGGTADTSGQTSGDTGWRRRAFELALVVPAVLILAGWLVVALVHLGDRYEVGHGQGVWMALAQHANTAGLYPEVFDGTAYGGSRYMPLPIVLHAAVAGLTGDYLVSGKLLGLLLTAALVAATYALLRRLGCGRSVALALAASVIGGFAGLRAGSTIGGEPLPVLLGVGALAVVLHSRGRAALGAAALLSALGVAAKLTALWAPLAIAVWLLRTDRRRAAEFGAYTGAATAAVLGFFALVSDGRMVDNLTAGSAAGIHGALAFAKAAPRLVGYVVAGEPGIWLLLPVAVVGAAARRWRGPTAVLPLAWAVAAALLLVVYADVGTGPNQLLDLAVLTALCVGAVVGSADRKLAAERMLVTVTAVMLVWVGLTAFTVNVRPPLQDALVSAAAGQERHPRNPLAEQLTPGATVLSEDPGLLVEQGRTPVVFDPFMLRRLAETHPAAVDALVERIDRREFDLVVLVVELTATDDVWWRDYHFGTDVIAAIDRSYEYAGRVAGYHLYRPAP